MGKTNGFSWPLTHCQILSWVIILWHSLLPGFILPITAESAKYLILPLSFYLVNLLVIILGFFVTKSNPFQSPTIDPIRYLPFRLNQRLNFAYYCITCKMFVPRTSKHCAICQKCIEGFDHHCKLLNNCIGSKNYRLFWKLLALVIAYFGLLIAYEAVSILDLNGPKKIIILIDLSINIIIFIIVGILGVFHCYLKIKGIGTYDFFMRSSKACKQVSAEEKLESNQICGKSIDNVLTGPRESFRQGYAEFNSGNEKYRGAPLYSLIFNGASTEEEPVNLEKNKISLKVEEPVSDNLNLN